MCSNCAGDYERPEADEPEPAVDPFQAMLERCHEQQKAVREAHSSWAGTKMIVNAVFPDVKL